MYITKTVKIATLGHLSVCAPKDVFSGSVHESGAADFGALGISFRARRPQNEEEWEAALAALTCKVPIWPTSPLRKL